MTADPIMLRWPRLWLALLGSAQALMVLLSLLPMPIAAPPVEHWDKWAHLATHAGLALFALMIFRRGSSRCLALGWQLLLGVLVEGLQGLLPWRSMEAADLLANALGLGLGSLVGLTPLRDGLHWLERRLPLPGAQTPG